MSAVREITHIEGGKGKSPLALGIREDSIELKIKIGYDKDQRTITISDNGIGMTRDEVIEHIGTIAKSGTRAQRDRWPGFSCAR